MSNWWITNTQQRIPAYIFRATLTTLIPAMVVGLLLAATGLLTPETAPEFTGPPDTALFLYVVVAPVLETLLLAAILWVIGLATQNLWVRAGISALVWAGLHSAAAPMWGPVVLWPFFVFSCAYLAWRKRSLWHALGIACCIHMAHNLLPSACAALLMS
jgi:hypothetical protein